MLYTGNAPNIYESMDDLELLMEWDMIKENAHVPPDLWKELLGRMLLPDAKELTVAARNLREKLNET